MRTILLPFLAAVAALFLAAAPASARRGCDAAATCGASAAHSARHAQGRRAHYKKPRHRKAYAHRHRGRARFASRRKIRYASHRHDRSVRRAHSASSNGGAAAVAAGGGAHQSGIASYYWQGQRVASGGRFNPNALTAAHRTLPFGTRVRVTNVNNGRSVEVVINDRGPFVRGRVIDLSRAAADVIGMRGAGLARVRLSVLGRS